MDLECEHQPDNVTESVNICQKSSYTGVPDEINQRNWVTLGTVTSFRVVCFLIMLLRIQIVTNTLKEEIQSSISSYPNQMGPEQVRSLENVFSINELPVHHRAQQSALRCH